MQIENWLYVALIVWVIFGHWIADFVLQSHWMASNKSKRWDALAIHVTVYTLAMTAFAAPVLWWTLQASLLFAAVTFVAHFVTDAITSRITSRLYAKGSIHNFFVVIGFDQFLHYAQVLLTLNWLLN